MKGQSTKSRVSSLEKQIARLQSRLNKIIKDDYIQPYHFVTPKLIALWGTFTSEQKVAINELADDLQHEYEKQAGVSL